MAAAYAGSVAAFLVALLVGGLAIYPSATLVVGHDDYGHAVLTALLGAIGWALTVRIPPVGLLVALVVWIGVINRQYPAAGATPR